MAYKPCVVRKPIILMKLTTVFLVGLSLGTYASGRAQTINLSMKHSKVEKVIEEISKQSNMRYFFNEELFRDSPNINFSIKNGKFNQAMKKVLKGSELTYQIIDSTIVIKEKSQVQVAVSGRVYAESGVLSGVTIQVENRPNLKVLSNENGDFSIRVPLNSILIFKHIGYSTQKVEVTDNKPINVKLESAESHLDEIVVVGYGTQKRVNLTGAVDQVSNDVFENRPVTNIGTALQGLISNLNVTNPSGSPIQGARFNIRGITSINGGEPLILVDNIPTTSDELARLNPNDFENVSVLKDAASAAIYGARGAFGVILITTKSAKSEKLQVQFGANSQWKTLGKMPEVITNPLTVMQYKHDAAIPLYNLFPEGVREYARKINEDPSLPRVIINPTNPEQWSYYGETDWMKEAYRNTSPTHTVNLNLGRRTEKLGYLFSSEYYKQDGLLKYGNDKLNRYNIRSKVDAKVNSWLAFENNTVLTNRTYGSPVFLDGDFFWNVNRTSSLDVPRNPDGSWTKAGANLLGFLQDAGRRNRNINEVQSTFSVKSDIIKNKWTANADVTFRRGYGTTDSYNKPVPFKTGPNAKEELAGSVVPWASKLDSYSKYNVINLYSQYNEQINDHAFSALAGFNQEYRYEEIENVKRTGQYSTDLPSIGLSSGASEVQHYIDDWAVQGFFYRINYAYKDKYLFESNGRFDGSSRFPKGDRWGYFPSVSAGWVASEESFLEFIRPTVNFLKIRASYGQLGNQMIYNNSGQLLSYPYIPFMNAVTNIPRIIDGVRPVSLTPPLPVAKSLSWERVSTINAGFDFSSFNNRLGVNYDIYQRENKGMLVQGKALPGVFGAPSPSFNAADMKTNGWELKISWRDQVDLLGSPLEYKLGFNIANSKAYITKYDNPTNSLNNYYIGKRIGEIWGLYNDGFFQNEAELKELNQTAVGTDDQSYKFYVGDIKFKDLNGDKKIDFGKRTLDDHGDMVVLGNSEAQYPYSFDLSGAWKGFDVRFFLQGIGKRDWYPNNAIYFWGIYSQPWTNVTKQNMDHWTPENPNAYFPRVKAYSAEDAMQELSIPNDRYLQNAAYLRVKNITLGYSVPSKWMGEKGFKSLRFYVSGENLFEHSKLKVSLDPETVFNTGVYPFQRTYSFGMNAQF